MKCIIDTNVPVLAGKSIASLTIEEAKCAKVCLEFIGQFIKTSNSMLILDFNGKIYEEYRRNIQSKNREPTMAQQFLDWVHIYINKSILPENHIQLNEVAEDEFLEFPVCSELDGFDRSDRKFIALANAHPEHPPIIEGTDSKWWRYREVFARRGIKVRFLCESYIRSMQPG